MRVRRDLLRTGTGDPNADVILNLFDDLGPLRVRPKSIEQTRSGRVWSGDLVNQNGYVILTDGPGGIYGIIRIMGHGDVVLRGFRDDLSVAAQSPARQPIACALHSPYGAAQLRENGASDDEIVNIDVLTLVSLLAVCGESGCDGSDAAAQRCSLQSEMNIWFYDTNTILERSHVNARLRWIGYQEFDVGERDDLTSTVAELVNPTTPRGAAVLTARNTTSADIVAVVVNTGTDHGAAQPLDSTKPASTQGNQALAVVKRWDALSEYIFSHEIGHNLGAGHEDGHNGYFSASRAWADEARAHTVMGITTGNVWTFYSNQVVPNPNRPGTTIGDATHDNAGTINAVRQAAANWRLSAPADFVPACQ